MKQKEIAPVCGTTGSFKLPIILGGSSNANVSNMGNFEGFPLQYCLSWVGNIYNDFWWKLERLESLQCGGKEVLLLC